MFFLTHHETYGGALTHHETYGGAVVYLPQFMPILVMFNPS